MTPITNDGAMPLGAHIYVAGHRGLAGSALVRRLQAGGWTNILARTHADLDLTDQYAVRALFETEKPEYVFLAAARVGGIIANNTYPAEFILSNLAIQTNVIHEAYRAGVKRLIFLGSSCVYPRDCPQPIKEDYLLTGALEATNRPYAVAKIAGIEMCWSYNRQYGTKFLAAMPTNLYGPGDNYDLQNSHVLPALIRKFHEAKQATNHQSLPLTLITNHQSPITAFDTNHQPPVVIWGTGAPRREFLYSGDMANACVFLMNLPAHQYQSLVTSHDSPPLINIGCGEDLSIKELAQIVAKVVGFDGQLHYDTSKPDGTPRKLLDVSRLRALGWRSEITLEQGLTLAYRDFLDRGGRT